MNARRKSAAEAVVYLARVGAPASRQLAGLPAATVAHALRLPGIVRRRFLAGRILEQSVLAATLGVPFGEVPPIERSCESCGGPHGRPRLPEGASTFSLSRAGDHVAVAVLPPPAGCSPAEAVGARDRLGLDLEPLPESEADAERLPGIETVADDRELADWKGPVTPRRLLVTWTRKEALLKASGLGLAVPLPQVRLGPPDDPPRLLARPGHQGFDGPVALADLDVDGFAGSLAILGRERIAHRVVRLPDTSTLE